MSGLRFGLSLSMQGRGGKAWKPSDLFETGSGFLYDFSRADALFQEAMGITPAGVDQNVGLALDVSKWGGKTLAQVLAGQPELVTNGTFDSDTAWTKGTGWSISGGKASIDGSNGATSYLAAIASPTYVVGRTYRLSFDYSLSSGRFRFNPAGGTTSAFVGAGSGTFSTYVVASSTSGLSIQAIDAGTIGWVDNISVKEIPGNHASQGTSGARPVIKAGGLTRHDGSDDNLLTTLVPSAAMTLAFKGKVTSASKGIISSRTTSTDAVELAINASGNLIGNVGSATSAGTSDIRGVTGVGVLVFDASTSKLYWNGSQIDSGPRSGSVNTTVPFRIGCRNTSGTGSIFADADIYKILAINRALTPAEIVKLTNAWSH